MSNTGYRRDGLVRVEGAWRLWETGNYDAMRRELAAVPGVSAVGRTNLGIATSNKNIQYVQAPGGVEGLDMGLYKVDPEFFATMGMRLIAGRLLGDRQANDRIPRDPQTTEGELSGARAEEASTSSSTAAPPCFSGYRDPAAAVGQTLRMSIGAPTI